MAYARLALYGSMPDHCVTNLCQTFGLQPTLALSDL